MLPFQVKIEPPLYSIQTVYNLYMETTNSNDPNKALKIRCKNVIEVPVAEPTIIDLDNYRSPVIPATALVGENFESASFRDVKIVIETNEGVTVEPTVVEYPDVVQGSVYLLYLPRGTTGIKKVSIRGYDAFGVPLLNDLIFGVMESPYNYENCLFAILNNQITQLESKMAMDTNDLDIKIASLESRVSALENKVGN